MKLQKNKTPYYVQLMSIFREKIRSGEVGGRRLPPIRQVSREYGVSVNTVLRAYEGLRREGIIAGSVGRGTFVVTTREELRHQNREFLLQKTIEHALEEALALEFTMEEFVGEVRRFVDRKREMMHQVKLVFIECNTEQMLYFTDHLELDPHIHRTPLLLESLRRDGDASRLIAGSDIVVTSFYHLDEVQQRVGSLGVPVVGINLEPETGTIIKVAKIPQDSTVGIVTTSEEFGDIIREVLDHLGLRFAGVLSTSAKSDEEVRRVVSRCDAVLVSPRREKQVGGLAAGKAVIEFVFTPDRTSINNLKVALVELNKPRPPREG